MNHANELEVALRAAKKAGDYLVEAYADFVAIPNARADITTEADRQSQEIILQEIHKAFPTDALCAEEQTPTVQGVPHTGPRLWIVDPIDGTRGFAQKNGEFSVMIAFVQTVREADKEVARIVVGVVSEPAKQRVTYASWQQGCWWMGEDEKPQRCAVRSTARLEDAILVQSHSRNPGIPTREVELIRPGQVRETHSAGVKLALVARGEADLYTNYYPNFHDWDICAGQILVTEAGGIVTGMKGQEIIYGLPGAHQRHGLLAATASLYPLALERLKGA